MNFITIVSDTFRRDHLGCYGNEWISTPHIDSLAERAVVFDRAYANSFPTVPHRRDLLTGRFTATYTAWAPMSQGHSEIAIAAWEEGTNRGIAEERTLSEVLGANGYVSMMVTDGVHLLENGYHFDRGFDGFEWIRGQETDRWKTYPEAPEHPSDVAKIRDAAHIQQRHRRNIADRRYESDTFVARVMTSAAQWLEDNYRHERFFLYVDAFDPHEPWDAPQWYVDMYDPGYSGDVVDSPLYWYTDFLTEAELKHCRALYAAEVTLVDRWVGMLLQKIEDLGLLENTTVLFTSDHGFLLGEHGIIGKGLMTPGTFTYIPLYDEISHVPLIVYSPEAEPRRSQAIVQPMDIMPTLADLSGASDPGTMHGRSFRDVLSGQRDEHNALAVATPFMGSNPCPVTVVSGNWTGVLYARKRSEGTLVDRAVDGYDKVQDVGDVSTEDLLFDISKDPEQSQDVKGQHPEILEDFRSALLDRLAEVGTAKEIIERWV